MALRSQVRAEAGETLSRVTARVAVKDAARIAAVVGC
jgi:hypothetical protein